MDNRHLRTLKAWRFAVWGGAALLLMLPAIAMRFTREVDWDETDFIVMGTLLLSACSAFEIAARMARNHAYLLGALAAIGTGFLLVWINLAVGVIGREDNPANLLFAGVPITAIVGSLVARLQARGMARAMYATAGVQVLIGAYAASGPYFKAAVLCLVFAGFWTISGLLFAHAGRDRRNLWPASAPAA
jgi:hypothetical protein